MRLSPLLVLAAALAPSAAGCLSKEQPTVVRYFDPPAPLWPAEVHDIRVPLRIGRIVGQASLSQPMMWRLSKVEVGFDDEHRWVAIPTTLVQNALVEALFVGGPYEWVELRDVPQLDVFVTAFEGSLMDEPSARVALTATVHDRGSNEAYTQRFSAEVPIAQHSASALAEGVSLALQKVMAQVRGWLDQRLMAH